MARLNRNVMQHWIRERACISDKGQGMKSMSLMLLSALVVLVVASAGCAQHRIASYCRYVDDEGLARYASPCTSRKTGEYIVSLGSDTEPRILNDIYGRYQIQTITEVKAPAEYGKQHVRRFLLVLSKDPGPEKMQEIAANATGFIRPYVNITPNREKPADGAEEAVNCVVAGERRWTQRSKCD